VTTAGKDLHPQRVPDAESATADPRKFTHYLFNEDHECGRGKAKFFKMNGYDNSRAEELRETLLAQLPYVEGRYSVVVSHPEDDAYTVEVVDAKGRTLDLVDARAEDLRITHAL
jgi:hypothetical protein